MSAEFLSIILILSLSLGMLFVICRKCNPLHEDKYEQAYYLFNVILGIIGLILYWYGLTILRDYVLNCNAFGFGVISIGISFVAFALCNILNLKNSKNIERILEKKIEEILEKTPKS